MTKSIKAITAVTVTAVIVGCSSERPAPVYSPQPAPTAKVLVSTYCDKPFANMPGNIVYVYSDGSTSPYMGACNG